MSYVSGRKRRKSDNARLDSYIYVDVAGRDLGSVVEDLQQAIAEEVALPAGYAIGWSGQYEFMQRAAERLRLVVPATLLIIFGLLWLVFRRGSEAGIIMLSLPLDRKSGG